MVLVEGGTGCRVTSGRLGQPLPSMGVMVVPGGPDVAGEKRSRR